MQAEISRRLASCRVLASRALSKTAVSTSDAHLKLRNSCQGRVGVLCILLLDFVVKDGDLGIASCRRSHLSNTAQSELHLTCQCCWCNDLHHPSSGPLKIATSLLRCPLPPAVCASRIPPFVFACCISTQHHSREARLIALAFHHEESISLILFLSGLCKFCPEL